MTEGSMRSFFVFWVRIWRLCMLGGAHNLHLVQIALCTHRQHAEAKNTKRTKFANLCLFPLFPVKIWPLALFSVLSFSGGLIGVGGLSIQLAVSSMGFHQTLFEPFLLGHGVSWLPSFGYVNHSHKLHAITMGLFSWAASEPAKGIMTV